MIKRLDGPAYQSKRAAEKHGLELGVTLGSAKSVPVKADSGDATLGGSSCFQRFTNTTSMPQIGSIIYITLTPRPDKLSRYVTVIG